MIWIIITKEVRELESIYSQHKLVCLINLIQVSRLVQSPILAITAVVVMIVNATERGYIPAEQALFCRVLPSACSHSSSLTRCE
jgi:hypothetical protein